MKNYPMFIEPCRRLRHNPPIWCWGKVLTVTAGRLSGAEARFRLAGYISFVQMDIHHIAIASSPREKGATYIVIPCGPAGVQLHVKLSLLPGQLVVLCLLFSGQRVPLEGTG